MTVIHRKKICNAKGTKALGAPVVAYSTPYLYVDRNITPELISDAYKVPIIFSSLSYLNRLCFGGLDFRLESVDGKEDDTKQSQIDAALPQIKKIDASLARIGRMKNCTTLDCVRVAAMELWSWRKCLFEKATSLGEGNVYSLKLQNLPGDSFNRTPSVFLGNRRYQPDDILKGILFDTSDAEIRFYQNVDSMLEPVEIPADQVLYIEDIGVPHNTSLLHSIMSTIEFLKQARDDFRLALKRVGIPKEVASIDGRELAALKTAGINISGGYQTLVSYANELIANQSSNQAEVALPGVRLSYPSIPIAINPMEVEKFIEQIILNHFFGKAITEQLAQAISVSSTPGKQLLDTVISGHQEVAGKPFEQLWTDWLAMNGYDLVMKFDYWSWSPADQKANLDKAIQTFGAGLSLINDARASLELDPYTPEQIKQLLEEQNALKRGMFSGAEKT